MEIGPDSRADALPDRHESMSLERALRLLEAVQNYGEGGELSLAEGDLVEGDSWSFLISSEGRLAAANWTSFFAREMATLQAVAIVSDSSDKWTDYAIVLVDTIRTMAWVGGARVPDDAADIIRGAG